MSTSAIYSARSAPAIGFLKSSSNDIEVFVEDSASPNMWVKLLKKYLPDHIRLNSVTSLGGRKNVLDACKADQGIDGRKKLYIIDGDLDLIQGKRKPNLKHLYRLRAYCVENYLLNEDAILELTTIFDGKIDIEKAWAKFDYTSWRKDNAELMKRLFTCYAVSDFLLTKKIETVGFSITRLAMGRPNNDCLCLQKTRGRILGVYRETRKEIDSVKLRTCLDAINTDLASKNFEDIASGKDCIMPLLYARMKNLFKMNVSMDVFLQLLADKANNQFDPYLSRRLFSICS